MVPDFPLDPIDGQVFENYVYNVVAVGWLLHDPARDSALAMLANLGLTPEEIASLVG